MPINDSPFVAYIEVVSQLLLLENFANVAHNGQCIIGGSSTLSRSKMFQSADTLFTGPTLRLQIFDEDDLDPNQSLCSQIIDILDILKPTSLEEMRDVYP